MEIEKARETSWRIQIKNQNEKIELTSVEISGDVRNVRLKLAKGNDEVVIELTKEEFFNFLSLVSAFKEVVIGDEQNTFNDVYTINDEDKENSIIKKNVEFEKVNSLDTTNSLNEEKSDELNPEEWDPW